MNNNRINEIKKEIFENEVLAKEGIRIYENNRNINYLCDAVFFQNRANKLRQLLEEEFNIL